MIKMVLITGIASLVLGTLIYFRFFNQKDMTSSNAPAPSISTNETVDAYVNQTLPPTPTPTTTVPTNLESRIKALENAVLNLQTQVTSIKNQTPAPVAQASSPKYPLYIPLGAGGQAGDKGWYSLYQYQVSIDPSQYSGYSSMQLEVNYRLLQKSGVANVRLLNSTDNQPVSNSEVTTTSDQFSFVTSGGFTLSSGNKTYKMQIKSTEGVEMQIESARIKVNF